MNTCPTCGHELDEREQEDAAWKRTAAAIRGERPSKVIDAIRRVSGRHVVTVVTLRVPTNAVSTVTQPPVRSDPYRPRN